jgi:hypothetical protein
MPLSSKLCFASADHARARRSDADAGKQSFQDKCVPKLELGNEGHIFAANRGLATPGYSWMTPPGSPAQLPDLTACLVLRGQESGPAFACRATPKKINPHS